MDNNKLKTIISDIESAFKYINETDTYYIDSQHKLFDNILSAVYKSHNDMLPSNWIYKKFYHIIQSLSGYDIDNMDDIDNFRNQIIDNNIDIYNTDLKKWIIDVSIADQYIEYAMADNNSENDFYKLLQSAQFLQLDNIFNCITDLIVELANKK